MRYLNRLLLLLMTVPLTSWAQDYYLFGDSTNIIDLPGGEFLTYSIRNNKVYLQERGLSGNVLWSDSLNNSGEIQTLQKLIVQEFGETDKYHFFLQGAYTEDLCWCGTQLSL